MEVVLWHKFTQHKSLKKMLLDTGDRHITFVSLRSNVQPLCIGVQARVLTVFCSSDPQVSPVDSFWGAGRDGTGKNNLGKALEKTRWRIKTCTPPARVR